MRMKLDLSTLKDFDFGKAAISWQEALRRMVLDVLDRPGEKKAREVQLIATIRPVLEQGGDVVDAEVAFSIKTRLPSWQTAPRPTLITKKGELLFSEIAPDNPRQRTIDEAIGNDD